ncbi:aspartate-semialdehyde dehydrogenase [Conexibacter sp. SYSU D00693]|uniref:aspartate-semialdehyde dehydrogenase n=1 Tax=Conexibacter sp. SYSU D00693 TaxID=2812560 RepID=UPI001F11FFC0|nr:aspartate-semialdehyde dehydrogenase [Conexibacter sp. SYSU D00693]
MTRVAVVGATGAVGTAMLRLLHEREGGIPDLEVVPIASARSAGRELHGGLVVQALEEGVQEGFDIAIFSAGGSTSKAWAPKFAQAGAVVVDNSSAWRMDDDVPLVVAEVNPDALDRIGKGIVANPNCTTMQIMLPLKALHDAFGLTDLVATSFQAAGGAGQKGMDELADQVEPLMQRRDDLVAGKGKALEGIAAEVHAKPLAFNVVPWLGSEKDGGYTDEELKLMNESRKILDLPELRVSPTCVRVPVFVGHSVQCRATFRREVDLDEALRVLEAFPGEVVHNVPTPVEYAGRDEVAVGRVRKDLSDPKTLNLFVVGDNLLKGAALNTVQIAELLVQRGVVGGARAAA